MVVEREFDYVFGADFAKDSWFPIIIHKEMIFEEPFDWESSSILDEIGYAEAELIAKEMDNKLYQYASAKGGLYSGGVYLSKDVLDIANSSATEFFYAVTGTAKIVGHPCYVIYGNYDKEQLAQGIHGGSIVAVSVNGNLFFDYDIAEGSGWIFTNDTNEKIIVPN